MSLKRPARQQQETPTGSMTTIWQIALLWSAVGLVYQSTTAFSLLHWDDDLYIAENPRVMAGLTWSGMVWAWTQFYAANYHPITWMSLMLDVTLYGWSPWGFHFTNVVLHGLNVSLVYLLFQRLRVSRYGSLLIALLLAIHPVHVESVAWATERKDVLSLGFGLLALLTLGGIPEDSLPKTRWILAWLLLAASLLCKPLMVTFPCLMVLLECHRAGWKTPDKPGLLTVLRMVTRYGPFLVLSLGSCVLTYLAQSEGGAVQTITGWGIREHLAVALTGYSSYLFNLVWPFALQPLYPLNSETIAVRRVIVAMLVLVPITTCAIGMRCRRPAWLTGWLWFLGTLVPMIGIVQVGNQAYADRYAYLPFLGLYWILADGLSCLAEKGPGMRRGIVMVCVPILIGLGGMSWKQSLYWKNDFTLWERAVQLNPRNAFAHTNLGAGFIRIQDPVKARYHLDITLEISPNDPHANYNLGLLFAKQGKISEATEYFAKAVKLYPSNLKWRASYAKALSQMGHFDQAFHQYSIVLAAEPINPEIYYSLGVLFDRKRDSQQALDYYRKALQLDPKHDRAKFNYDHLTAELESQEKKKMKEPRSDAPPEN